MLIQVTTESLTFMLSSKLKVSIAFYNPMWNLSNVGKLCADAISRAKC